MTKLLIKSQKKQKTLFILHEQCFYPAKNTFINNHLLFYGHCRAGIQIQSCSLSNTVLIICLGSHHGGVIPAQGQRRHKKTPSVLPADLFQPGTEQTVGGHPPCYHQLLSSCIPCRFYKPVSQAIYHRFPEGSRQILHRQFYAFFGKRCVSG